jgi:hypothetical protein
MAATVSQRISCTLQAELQRLVDLPTAPVRRSIADSAAPQPPYIMFSSCFDGIGRPQSGMRRRNILA